MLTTAAVVLGLVLLGGLALLVSAWVAGRAVGSAVRPRVLVLPAVLLGLASVCFALFGAAFWHYGGRLGVEDDGNPYVCSAGWVELGSVNGAAGDLRSGGYCRAQVDAAVGPVLGVSVAVGAGVAGSAAGLLALRRRGSAAARAATLV